jgi:hypothetical protein
MQQPGENEHSAADGSVADRSAAATGAGGTDATHDRTTGAGGALEPASTGGRWRSPKEPCPNCGDPTPGRFCPACGQRKTVVQVSVGTIVGEVLKDELALNSALPRTLLGILFRPGFLTSEYIRGRVVRYIPPLRLYLISSILFFLSLSFIGLRALDRVNFASDDGQLTQAQSLGTDSVIAMLQARRDQLAGVDTANLPVIARSGIRQALFDTEQALAAAGDPARAQAVAQDRTAYDGRALPPGVMQPWAQDALSGMNANPFKAGVERRMQRFGHLPPREAIRGFLAELLEYAPHAMFLLLPAFALMLKLLYIRRGRFFAEHFVFALHVHAFFFLTFFVMLAIPWRSAIPWMAAWMALYVWLAMKRVYRQGWFRTTAKWGLLAFSYLFILLFGLVGLVLSAIIVA